MKRDNHEYKEVCPIATTGDESLMQNDKWHGQEEGMVGTSCLGPTASCSAYPETTFASSLPLKGIRECISYYLPFLKRGGIKGGISLEALDSSGL